MYAKMSKKVAEGAKKKATRPRKGKATDKGRGVKAERLNEMDSINTIVCLFASMSGAVETISVFVAGIETP